MSKVTLAVEVSVVCLPNSIQPSARRIAACSQTPFHMAAIDSYNLKPPLIEAGKFKDIVDAGQTITSTWSPADNNLAIYITNAVRFASIAVPTV